MSNLSLESVPACSISQSLLRLILWYCLPSLAVHTDPANFHLHNLHRCLDHTLLHRCHPVQNAVLRTKLYEFDREDFDATPVGRWLSARTPLSLQSLESLGRCHRWR